MCLPRAVTHRRRVPSASGTERSTNNGKENGNGTGRTVPFPFSWPFYGVYFLMTPTVPTSSIPFSLKNASFKNGVPFSR